jgi:hypothetical protein
MLPYQAGCLRLMAQYKFGGCPMNDLTGNMPTEIIVLFYATANTNTSPMSFRKFL